MNGRRPRPGLLRGGLVVQSMLLVVATALAVDVVVVRALGQQVEQAADRRLAEGAALFLAQIESRGAALAAVGAELATDPGVSAATRARQADALGQALTAVFALSAVDEIVVADAGGEVLETVRAEGSGKRGGNLAESPGFRAALGGAARHGVGLSAGRSLQQELWAPILAAGASRPVGVLRLARLLDQAELDRFRAISGLDASLSFGEELLASTVGPRDGGPLVEIGGGQARLGEVVAIGHQLYAWAQLPFGRVRSRAEPLLGPDGTPIGVLVVTVQSSSLEVELREALLPAVPITGLMMLAGAILAYLLVARLRRPALQLAQAAARLRDGDLSTPIPPVREKELAPLAEELERARASVQANLQAIAREDARQRALFSALRDPIITTAADGKITSFNQAALDLFGGRGDLQGRTIQELLPFVSSRPESPLTEWHGQLERPVGEAMDLAIRRTTLAEGGQLPATDVYVVHDVSHHAELSRLREQLLYDIAHELRTPLAVLDNSLEVLAADYGELSAQELDQLLRSALRTAGRLRNLTEGLLTAGSIQSGRFVVSPRPTDVSELVGEALDAVQDMLEMRQQRIERQGPGPTCQVLADAPYARMALVNLLTNASKYSPDGKAIGVRVEPGQSDVCISIEDHGPGIVLEEQAELFERFYRAQPGQKTPGAGLGLAIVKGIVQAHGGSVGVESKLGVGSRFWLTLPRERGSFGQ